MANTRQRDAWRLQGKPRRHSHIATSYLYGRSGPVGLEDGHCKLYEVLRSAVQPATPIVITEITIECLRVCKWQHSFTLRSVGKVGCGIGTWNFLEPRILERTSTDVIFASTSKKYPICETVRENSICEFGCAGRRQSDCSHWSYRTGHDWRCWSM